MGVEIGTLVLRGQFGAASQDTKGDARARAAELEILRREMLRELEDMLASAADRPAWDR